MTCDPHDAGAREETVTVHMFTAHTWTWCVRLNEDATSFLGSL